MLFRSSREPAATGALPGGCRLGDSRERRARGIHPTLLCLEGLLAALVHLKAAAVEGGVQEGHTVHRRAPGHVEDPCAEQAASGQAPAPYYPPLRHPRTAREPGAPVPGPGLSPEPTRPALTGHTGVHQRHTGPRAERPEHDLGEVTLPLGSHGGCRRTGGLRARTLQAPLPPLCASGCIC